MNRKPPKKVRELLRREVGFGCPVPNCGSPYLEYHHFDPPFAVEAHHRAEGMIALCTHHHPKADAGAFTDDQLREFKTNKVHADMVRGSFDWLRNDLLLRAGSSFYYKTTHAIVIDDHNVISFLRDEDGYLRLNVNMLSLRPEQRAIITMNDWENIGEPTDLICPPSGKELRIAYSNGDSLSIDFSDVQSAEGASKKFEGFDFSSPHLQFIKYPVTFVEVNFSIGDTDINFSPTANRFLDRELRGGFFEGFERGIDIRTGFRWRQNLSKVDES